MPYAGEHSCRLIAPSEFSEFRRQNNFRQVDGKRVDAVFGIRDGKAELSAMRYPKDIWTSADARSHCSSQDGILFEPASVPEIREARMAHVTKFIRPEIKILDKAAGLITAVVSTESMDRDGDIIRQAHWDLDHFKAHPILLSSHNYRGLRNQIGEWIDMKVEGSQLVGEAKYYIKEGNEEADWGFNLAKKGRAAFSVGFVPDMAKAKQIDSNGNLAYEFQGQELLEVSQVTVPSNAEALQSLKGVGLHPDMDNLVTELLDEMNVTDITEQVRYEAGKMPETTPIIFDRKGFAEEIAAIVRADIKRLLIEQRAIEEEELSNLLPTADDIVRGIIHNYKEAQ